MAYREGSPHTLNPGWGCPRDSPAAVQIRLGEGVGAEPWILQRLTKGLGSWARISHPWPPTLVT